MVLPRPRVIQSVASGHTSKQFRQAREDGEKKNKVDRSKLFTPPRYLSDVAQEIYRDIVDTADKVELWDDLDITQLGMLAQYVATFQYASVALSQQGFVLDVVTATGLPTKKVNPLVYVQSDARKAINELSSKLGLSSVDRLKLIAPVPEERQNKFIELLRNA